MNDYPLIKFVIIFICGVIIESVLGFQSILLFIISALSVITAIVFHVTRNERISSLKNFSLACAILLCSMLHYSTYKNEITVYPFDEPKNKNAMVFGKVTNVELIREERIIFYIRTDSIQLKGRMQRRQINMLCTLRDSEKNLKSFYDRVKIGNEIKVKTTIVRARNERNPGEFDYENYLLNQGISAVAVIYKTGDVNIFLNKIDVLRNTVFAVRKSIDEKITSHHNKTTAGLVRGLILGDRSMIDNEIQTDFVNAGVVHVLSVSGLHVGFIILIFVFLFQRFNLYARFICTLIGLALYVILTNFQPPVTRAAIMGIAILFAPMTGRNTNSLNSLSLAAFVILLFKPDDLFNPGFQLSFSAILSILIFYPFFSRKINGLKVKSVLVKNILLFCSVSLAAQIGTLPFTLVYFHKLSLISLIANLFVIPVSGFIVELGIFTITIGYFGNIAANIFGSANELQTYILYWVVNVLGKMNIAFVRINSFSLYDGIIFYAVILFVFLFWKKLISSTAKMIFIIFSAATLILLFRIDNYDILPEKKLSIIAIDVGQGDSFLIKFPNGRTALIDAGDATKDFDNGKSVILPLIDRLDIKKIDYGFISHLDADHYHGYITLINEGRIKQIYKPKIDTSLARDIEFEKYLASKNIPVHRYSKRNLQIGDAMIYLLNDTTDNYFNSMSSNDKSGLIKLVYGNTSFLFTGDAGIKAEKYYIDYFGDFLDSDVLKVGHHGSKTSSSEQFIDFVKPKMAIISAGVGNKFRHPSKEVIERFKVNQTEIFRTDKTGAVLLQSDGFIIKNINWEKLERGFIF